MLLIYVFKVKEETDKVIINCLDITVKSASFSAGDSSEFVCLYKGGIFHCHVNFWCIHT